MDILGFETSQIRRSHAIFYAILLVLFLLSFFTAGLTSVFLKHTVALLLFKYILFVNRKQIIDIFRRSEKNLYRYALAIAAVGLAVLFFYSVNFATVDDWGQLLCAKSMVTGSEEIPCNPAYGFTYPYLLSLFFLVFGPATISAGLLSGLVYVLGGIAVFLSALLMFRDKRPALLSALVFMLSYHVVLYNALFRGRVEMTAFFAILTFFIFLLTFRTRSGSMIMASILILFFAAGVKYELLNLVYPLLIGVYIFMRYDERKVKIILLSVAISSLLFSGSFVSMGRFYIDQPVGDWDYVNRPGETPYSQVTDAVIRPLVGPYFSVDFAGRNLSGFIEYWSSGIYPFILLISVMGVLAYFRKNRAETALPLLCFFGLNALYMLYYVTYYPGYAVITLPFLVLFSGFGVHHVLKFLPKHRNHAFVLAAIVISLLMVYSLHQGISEQMTQPSITVDQNHEIAAKVKAYCREGEVIVPFFQTKFMLQFMLEGYEIRAFTDFFDQGDYDKFYSGVTDPGQYELRIPDGEACMVYSYRCRGT